jgi:hypothetical protein
MIQTSITLSGAAGLGINSESLFRKTQMQRLGEFGIRTVKARVARGVGSEDNAMRPLSGKNRAIFKHGKFVRQAVGYAAWKSKHGLQPIRDLAGTGQDGGHMLDNLTVRSVSESNVRMSLTARKARAKALSNEKKSPWLSFSNEDERKIVAYAAQMFHSQVEVIRRQIFKPGFRKAA